MAAREILKLLDFRGPLPVGAIEAARLQRDSVVPVLIEEFERFVSGGGAEIGPNALFFGFHLLGEWREKTAYRSLARFLQMPGETIEPVLGDAKTETAHRVMAAVFDGDPQPLQDVIRNKDADEFVRSRMVDALAMLTVSGDIPREATARFLRDCYDTLEPREDCYVWEGWQAAISRLALADMKPLVQEAFRRGSIHPGWLAFKDFEKDLQHAIDHPGAEPLHPDGKLTPFGDTIAELSPWHAFQPKLPPRPRTGRPYLSTILPCAIRSAMSDATIPVRAAAGRSSRNAASRWGLKRCCNG